MKPNPGKLQIVVRLMAIASLIAMMLAFAGPVGAAAPPQPTYAGADVDGQIGEWDRDASDGFSDFFATMTTNGENPGLAEPASMMAPTCYPLSKLYLRYDCEGHILYVLVLADSGYYVSTYSPSSSYVKVKPDGGSTWNKLVDGNSGDDGAPPDFAFYRSGSTALGWEASGPLAEGGYHLNVQTKIKKGSDAWLSAVIGYDIPLQISCPVGDKFSDANINHKKDAGEPLVGGWGIQLKNVTSGTITNVTTKNVTGDPAYGKWFFPAGLAAGTYEISEEQRTGWLQTYPNTNGGKYLIEYDSDGTYLLLSPPPLSFSGLSFGNVQFGPLGAIGDYVWHDEDRNGEQNEPVATHALGGISLRLLRDNGDGTLTSLGTKTTDSDGWYLFTELPEGNYLVDVAGSDLPDPAWTLTSGATYGPDPMSVSLALGEIFLRADFGFAGVTDGTVSLGDWVWWDKDNDAKQNDGTTEEVGLQCMTLRLYNPSGVLIGEKNTDSFGLYKFVNLPATVGAEMYTVIVDAYDPDLAQVDDYANPNRPCHRIAEWTDPSRTGTATASPDADFTTGTSVSLPVPSGYNPDFDFGANNIPTAMSIQAFGATALPLASIEVMVAATGALVAGALAWRRRRQ